MVRPNPIDVVEAAYDLSGDEAGWLRGVLAALRPLLDDGRGVAGYCYDRRLPLERWFDGAIVHAIDSARLSALRGHVLPLSDIAKHLHLIPPVLTSLHHELTRLAALGGLPSMYALLAVLDSRDVAALQTVEPCGRGVVFWAGQSEVRIYDPRTRRLWSRVAAHIAAARRLRKAMVRNAATLEAVLTPAGALVHAEGDAQEATALAALREAVVRQEYARGRARRDDPEQAIAAWTALVDGRWSLIDRFERGERRYVVARRNEITATDPRELSKREHEIVQLAQLGKSNKLMAYELGISESTVATHMSLAMRKLGVSTRSELIRLAADLVAEASSGDTFEIAVASDTLMVCSTARDATRDQPLTAAERLVAHDAAAGLSNAMIASRRGRSVHTVANQLQSIYRKLGLTSRAELAVFLSEPARHRNAG